MPKAYEVRTSYNDDHFTAAVVVTDAGFSHHVFGIGFTVQEALDSLWDILRYLKLDNVHA